MRILLIVAILIGALPIPLAIVGYRFDAGAIMDFIRSDGPWAAVAGIAAKVADLAIPFPAHAIMANFGMAHGWLVGGLLGVTGTFDAGVPPWLLLAMSVPVPILMLAISMVIPVRHF